MIIGGSTFSPFTEPSYMPFSVTAYGNSLIWTNTTTTYDNSSAFGTALARRGTSTSCANLGANTFKTICDLTGQGYMGEIMLPRPYGTNDACVFTVKLTLDGTVYERVSPSMGGWAVNRMFLGYSLDVWTGSTANSDGRTFFGYQREYFGNIATYGTDANGGLVNWQKYHQVLPPSVQLARGIPLISFNSSLKVEVKASLAFGNQTTPTTASVLHMLTGDLS